jgi:hypothetical protein
MISGVVFGVRYIFLKGSFCFQLIEKEDGKGATAGEIKLPEDLAYEESKVQGMLLRVFVFENHSSQFKKI